MTTDAEAGTRISGEMVAKRAPLGSNRWFRQSAKRPVDALGVKDKMETVELDSGVDDEAEATASTSPLPRRKTPPVVALMFDALIRRHAASADASNAAKTSDATLSLEPLLLLNAKGLWRVTVA